MALYPYTVISEPMEDPKVGLPSKLDLDIRFLKLSLYYRYASLEEVGSLIVISRNDVRHIMRRFAVTKASGPKCSWQKAEWERRWNLKA